MRKGFILWLFSCLLGSLAYLFFFEGSVYPEGSFQLRFGDHLVLIIVFFLTSFIVSAPVVLFFNKVLLLKCRENKLRLWVNLTMLIYFIVVCFVFYFFMNSIVDVIELIVSYIVIAVLAINLYLNKVLSNSSSM